MESNYAGIVRNNIEALYRRLPADLAQRTGAKKDAGGKVFTLDAFGKSCRISAGGIFLDDEPQTDVLGILISLYALNAIPEEMVIEPWKAFKAFPDVMPYVGAFTSHTEQILIAYEDKIKKNRTGIVSTLNGDPDHGSDGGDYSFMVRPLPKIALCYIVYEADEDFPASVTCLYSSNANHFLPNDALADVGEYTSKRILELLRVRATIN
ncbi:MAG: DUF3786 domain-containing protein [Desulfobacteraceae bacterium]|nr:DUF3786 domain-containing protein [Desulfobacteraceae bacterium]